MRATLSDKALAGLVWLAATLSAGCGGDGGMGQMWGGDVFRVSGSISAADGTTADSDVNDQNAPYAPNDSIATAQPISNPATVGGYVNEAGEGAPGRSLVDGDPDDYYRIELAAGQEVALTGSDFSSTRPDLSLYDSDGKLVALGTSAPGSLTASVRAPLAGTYFVNVHQPAGASNYILSAGLFTSAPDTALYPGHDFVPGEVMVTPRAAAGKQTAHRASDFRALGLEAKAGIAGGPLLLRLAGDEVTLPANGSVQSGPGTLPRAYRKAYETLSPEERLKLSTVLAVKALRERPDVLTADLNHIRKPTAAPSDTHYSYQWHYPLIQLPQAWDLVASTDADREILTREVTVAVIDTGVLLTHPDLAGKLDSGYDFISDPARALDEDGIDSDPNDPGDLARGKTSSFHGTHVAGTVGAATGNGSGVAGAGWGVRLMPIRVLGRGGGTDYDVLQGMLYAAGFDNDSGTVPARRADIINLSLGGAGYNATVQREVTRIVRDAGVIVVAAAGNENSSTPSYPAAYEGVVSVSAVGAAKNRASYSNFGATVDVAAPGGDASSDRGVFSTGGDDSQGSDQPVYLHLQGTSMATPHVAGVAALMKAVHPELTPQEFDSQLTTGGLTEDLGDPGKDGFFGWGLIDAARAVTRAWALAGGTAPKVPLLAVGPGTVNFRFEGTTATVSAVNAGTDQTLSVASVEVRPAGTTWLTWTAPDTLGGFGEYAFFASREGLAPGTYVATVLFTPSAGDPVSVQVLLQVAGASGIPSANAGHHYVLLLNAATWEVVSQSELGPTAGRYDFSFPALNEGSYLIVAGTDMDNDFLICDPGEACGAYQTLDQPALVSVDGDRSSLNFATSFAVVLPVQGAGLPVLGPVAVKKRPGVPDLGVPSRR